MSTAFTGRERVKITSARLAVWSGPDDEEGDVVYAFDVVDEHAQRLLRRGGRGDEKRR